MVIDEEKNRGCEERRQAGVSGGRSIGGEAAVAATLEG
jgi:hypothetical protein